jgi:cold-inducible RNA-binding protein
VDKLGESKVLEPNKIFVGGLKYETTESDLLEVFSNYGTVINVRIVKDQDTGKSKGFGFITFASPDHASKSLELDGSELNGRTIGVKLAFNKRASGL